MGSNGAGGRDTACGGGARVIFRNVFDLPFLAVESGAKAVQ